MQLQFVYNSPSTEPLYTGVWKGSRVHLLIVANTFLTYIFDRIELCCIDIESLMNQVNAAEMCSVSLMDIRFVCLRMMIPESVPIKTMNSVCL